MTIVRIALVLLAAALMMAGCEEMTKKPPSTQPAQPADPDPPDPPDPPEEQTLDAKLETAKTALERIVTLIPEGANPLSSLKDELTKLLRAFDDNGARSASVMVVASDTPQPPPAQRPPGVCTDPVIDSVSLVTIIPSTCYTMPLPNGIFGALKSGREALSNLLADESLDPKIAAVVRGAYEALISVPRMGTATPGLTAALRRTFTELADWLRALPLPPETPPELRKTVEELISEIESAGARIADRDDFVVIIATQQGLENMDAGIRNAQEIFASAPPEVPSFAGVFAAMSDVRDEWAAMGVCDAAGADPCGCWWFGCVVNW